MNGRETTAKISAGSTMPSLKAPGFKGLILRKASKEEILAEARRVESAS